MDRTARSLFPLWILFITQNFLLVSCVPPASPRQLTIAAAASLAPAFDAMGSEFTKETNIDLTFSYAATGYLAQQIRNGATFNIFASANSVFIDDLIREGYLQEETRTVIASGRLILLVSAGRGMVIDTLNDLQDPSIKPIAIANPAHAPYGLAAKEALERADLWQDVQDRLVFAESVKPANL
jgi:molybdate transport system substrate-binding protein